MSENFKYACETYKALGVDVEKALETLKTVSLGIHCWQGDDVGGLKEAVQNLTEGAFRSQVIIPEKPVPSKS